MARITILAGTGEHCGGCGIARPRGDLVSRNAPGQPVAGVEYRIGDLRDPDLAVDVVEL